MRTTPVLRSVAAALLTGGVLTGPFAPGALAANGPTHIATSGGSSDSSVRSAVVSGGDVNVRKHPTTKSPVVGRVSSRSHNPVLCSVLGERIGGDRTWYWLAGAGGWVSAAFADTGGQRVPSCDDRCPGWKEGASRQTPDVCKGVIASTRLP